MQDILLIAAVAAVFAFGWYLMGKLDAFLESNRQDQIALLSSSENILRIGFSDPFVADSLSGVLRERDAPEVLGVPVLRQETTLAVPVWVVLVHVEIAVELTPGTAARTAVFAE